MAINVSQAFHRTSANPVDDTMALTKAEMLTVNDNLMPSKYLTVCQDDGFIYLYDKSNEADPETGKFRKFEGGGGSSYTAGDGIDITNDVISTKQSVNGDMDEIVDELPAGGVAVDYITGTATLVSSIVSSGTVKFIKYGNVVQVMLTNLVFTNDSTWDGVYCTGLPAPASTCVFILQTTDNENYGTNCFTRNGEGALSKGGAVQIKSKTVYSSFCYIAKS